MSSTSNNNTTKLENDPIEDKSKERKKFDKWRKSLMYITGLGLSIEERKKIETELEKDIEEFQCKRCERWRDKLMNNSKHHISSFFFIDISFISVNSFFFVQVQ